MSERRSARSRKTVNYSGFDDLSDDDFAETTPPPPKKNKSSKKDEASAKSKTASRDKDWDQTLAGDDFAAVKSSRSGNSRRVPVSEKVYERELQEALQLSMLETGGSQDVIKDTDVKSQPASTAGKENQSQEPTATTDQQAASKPRLDHGTVVLDDSIEFLGEVEDESQNKENKSRQRTSGRQAKKKPAVVISDDENEDESDFNPEENDGDGADDDDKEDSGDDDDFSVDDGDSDFDDKSKKAKQKASKSKKSPSSAKTSTPAKKENKKALGRQTGKHQPVKATHPPAAVAISTTSHPAPSLPVTKPSFTATSSAKKSAKSATASSSSTSSSATTAVKRQSMNLPHNSSLTSTWKPPARASPGKTSLSSITSPSSGLRLGLSRNQRVKPLHPSVKVS